MLSRGFDGRLQHAAHQAWQGRDTIFLTVCLLGFVLARQVDLAQLLGALVLAAAP
jgi:hypothetical protein